MDTNVRYDDTIHATKRGSREPLCDEATIPACTPEMTVDAVTCIWCESLL